METEKRQRFLEACAPWTKVGMTDFFIRGYDDHQSGRGHAYIGATIAGDAYRAGWNCYGPNREHPFVPVLASRTPECLQEEHLTTRDEEGM